jgi:hypothetical protein
LVRHEAVQTIGGFEEERSLGMYEDQAFLAKLFLRFPVLVSDRCCWDRYRLHPGQRSVGRPFAEKRVAALAYFDWLERYLGENGSDATVRRALRQKRRRYRFPAWNRVFLRMRRPRKSLRPA